MRFGSVDFELNRSGLLEVLGLCTRAEMRWVDARRSVTTMQNLKPTRDRSIGKGERHTVRKPSCGTSAGSPEVAVAGGRPPALPRPADIGAAAPVNLGPKPFLNGAYDLLRAQVGEWVTMALPAAIMHTAPTTFVNRLQAAENRAGRVRHDGMVHHRATN